MSKLIPFQYMNCIAICFQNVIFVWLSTKKFRPWYLICFHSQSYWPGWNYYSTWEHTTKCSNVGVHVSGVVESKLNSTCQLFWVL